ncbi:hypothetical protein CHISP_1272 [Chitinispirillum alkaliphilum]|nr:hypothetical protein CHISP_1272 [Chitinispirillum alkaliphilum]
MTPEKLKKQQLLDFLDSKIFDPVLEALPEQYSTEREKKMLIDVQEIARYEKDHYHFQLMSAKEIKEEYLKEVSRDGGGRISRELEDLELPKLHLFREQFLDLCRELQI